MSGRFDGKNVMVRSSLRGWSVPRLITAVHLTLKPLPCGVISTLMSRLSSSSPLSETASPAYVP